MVAVVNSLASPKPRRRCRLVSWTPSADSEIFPQRSVVCGENIPPILHLSHERSQPLVHVSSAPRLVVPLCVSSDAVADDEGSLFQDVVGKIESGQALYLLVRQGEKNKQTNKQQRQVQPPTKQQKHAVHVDFPNNLTRRAHKTTWEVSAAAWAPHSVLVVVVAVVVVVGSSRRSSHPTPTYGSRLSLEPPGIVQTV